MGTVRTARACCAAPTSSTTPSSNLKSLEAACYALAPTGQACGARISDVQALPFSEHKLQTDLYPGPHTHCRPQTP